MRVYFGLIAAVLAFAALCGAALSWDGSGYLFETLDKQAPFVAHYRLISVPLQLPVLLLSHVTDSLDVLRAAFGLTYAAVPLVSLLASWWVVRDRARPLFIWPTLAIGLGMLPGQFSFTSEANLALQLFWPILLALLTGMRRQHVPLVVALSIAILCSHPYAIALFAFAAGVAVLVGLREKDDLRAMLRWALLFGAAAVIGLFVFYGSSYDTQQAAPDGLLWSFAISTNGLPRVALVCTALAAALIFATPFVHRRYKYLTPAVHGVELVCVVAAGIVLALWARDPQLWMWANKYTYPGLVVALCLMLLAVAERLAHTPKSGDGFDDAVFGWRQRLRTIQIVAFGFALVLGIQSAAWFNLTNRLRETIDQSTASCLSMAPVAWLQQTPLNQFDAPEQSILLQSRVPHKVLLTENRCTNATFTYGLPLYKSPTGLRGSQTGWFDLRPLTQQIAAEQNMPQGCSFMLSTGWYGTETDGPHWWRWTDGQDARMRVLLDRATSVVLNGQLQSVSYPNAVRVMVNGTLLSTVTITWAGLQAMPPLLMHLRQGENIVQLVSQKPAAMVDGRGLAIGVANLTAVSTDNNQICGLRP